MRQLIALVGCTILSLSLTSPARADGAGGGISIDAARLGTGRHHAAPGATRVAPRPPRMPAILAAGRPELQQTYTQVLAAFEQGLAKNGLPPNDVAVAAAMYLSGAYGAYHGTQVSDAAFVALVAQLRDALAATPAFSGASLAQKQDMYEALAITGAMMAVSAQQRPNDPAVRSTARTTLETFLHVGADSLQITDRGLVVATAPATGAPAPAAVAPAPSPAPLAPAAPPPPAFSPRNATAMLWKAEARYQAFPANGFVMVEEAYLLLADGTCTSGPPASFDAFDPASDRAAHPNRWCEWRKHGAGYEVAFDGKWRAVNGATVLRAAKRGEHVAGQWSRQKTGTVGTGGTWRGTTLVLTGAGRFELTRAAAFTTNNNLNRHPGELVATGSTSNAGDTAGTYALDGLGIELRFDSGRVERKMFGMSTDADHGVVRFGGEVMWKRK